MRGSITPTRPVGRPNHISSVNIENGSRPSSKTPNLYSASKNLVIEVDDNNNQQPSSQEFIYYNDASSSKPESRIPRLVLNTNMDHLNMNTSQPSFNLTSPDTLFGSIQGSRSSSNINDIGIEQYNRERLMTEERFGRDAAMNMQNQIKQTDLIKDYADKLNMVVDDNKKLKRILCEKNDEIIKLQREQPANPEKTTKIDGKTLFLIGEIEKLKTLANNREKDASCWKEKYLNLEKRWTEDNKSSTLSSASDECNKYARENERLNFLIRDKELKIEDYEEKIRLLSEEINRLSNLLCDRNLNIEQLKLHLSDLENTKTQSSSRFEDRLQPGMKWTDRNPDLEEIKSKYSLEKARVSELEEQISLLASKNEKLNDVLKSKVQQIQVMEIQMNSNENSFSDKRRESFKDNNDLLIQKIRSLEEENKRLLRFSRESQIKPTPSSSSNDLNYEIEHLRLINENKSKDLESMRKKVLDLEERSESVNELESQLKGSKNAMKSLENKLQIILKENEKLRDEINEKSSDLFNVRIEVERLNELESKLNFLSFENEKLIKSNTEKQAEIENLKERIIDQSKHQGKTQKLQQEIDSMREREIKRTLEIKELQQKVSEATSLEAEVVYLRKIVEDFEELKKQTRVEKEKLSKNHNNLQEDLGSWKAKLILAEKRIEETQSRLESTRSALDFIERERDDLSLLNNKLQEEIYQINAQQQSWEEKMTVLASENDRLATIIDEKKAEVLDLQSRFQNEMEMHERILSEQRQKWEMQLETRIELEQKDAQKKYAFEKERFEREMRLNEEAFRDISRAMENTKLENIELGSKYQKMIGENQVLLSSITQMKSAYELDIEKLRRDFSGQKLVLEENYKNQSERLERLMMEYNEINRMIKESELRRDEWKQKYEKEVEEHQEFQKLYQQYKQQIIDYKEIQIRWSAEKMNYEAQLNTISQKLLKSEDSRCILSEERDRLASSNAELTREIESLRNRMIALESSFREETINLNNLIDEYRKNSYDKEADLLRQESAKMAYESQVKQLKEIITNNKNELDRLYDLMKQRKTEFEDLLKTLESARKELSKYQRENQELMASVTCSEERQRNYRKEIDNLSRGYEEYKNVADKSAAELSRKNSEIVEKIEQFNLLKIKYEESMNNMLKMEKKLAELNRKSMF